MSYIDKRPVTIFCDIDGTLVTHTKPTDSQKPTHKLNLLEGTIEKILEWDKSGYNIILTTGRKESLREVTQNQLAEKGIIYDQLIMGVGGGKRYLINDRKPYGTEDYAIAINLDRNSGIKNIQI
jgi:uncharacterized HAD superfamily protein